MDSEGLATRFMPGTILSFGLLIGAAVVLVSEHPTFAQQTSTRVRRRLEVAPFDPNNPRGPYLGQRPPGMIPEVFAPGFISIADDEYAIAFSPDGTEIYFSRYTRTDRSNTIWVTRRTEGTWTSPTKAGFTGQYYNTEAFITTDNSRMYFISVRGGGSADFQIWTMNRTGGGWSMPSRLGQPFSNNIKMYPTAATNGNLYFTELASSTSRVLVAQNQNGRFAAPVPLAATVNAWAMGHAFVAPDESWLVFDAYANRPAADGGVLFVSFKGSGGAWLAPARLNLANMTDNEYCPAISPDGKHLFFARANGEHTDIWWVDARVVFDLKPQERGDP